MGVYSEMVIEVRNLSKNILSDSNWSIFHIASDWNCTKKALVGLVLYEPIGIPLLAVWFARSALRVAR